MYCGNCGQKLPEGALFCGNCGHQQSAAATETAASAASPVARQALVAQHSTSPSPTPMVEQAKVSGGPKAPMSRARKLQIGGGVVVVAVLAIAYVIARAMHGPATTDTFQTAFAKALHDKSSTELKHLIDPAQKDILNSKVLDAFIASLNPGVETDYEDRVQSAVEAQTGSADTDAATSRDKSLQLIKKSSWLGDKWYVRLPVIHVHNPGIEGDKVTYTIGQDSFSDTDSGPFIPSIYDVKVTAVNSFGSETGTASEDLRNRGATYELKPLDFMKNVLQIKLPDTGAPLTVTLNGKAVSAQSGQTTIAPAPANGKLQVSAKIGGVTVTGEQDVQGGQNSVDASSVLNTGVAKAALDCIFNYDTSWTKAWNDQNVSELSGIDPSSSAYQDAIQGMTNHTGQLTFDKLVVDPDSVIINGDGSVYIRASEFFTDQDGQQQQTDWDYTLQKGENGSGWWVEEDSTNWQSAADSPDAISKTP